MYFGWVCVYLTKRVERNISRINDKCGHRRRDDCEFKKKVTKNEIVWRSPTTVNIWISNAHRKYDKHVKHIEQEDGNQYQSIRAVRETRKKTNGTQKEGEIRCYISLISIYKIFIGHIQYSPFTKRNRGTHCWFSRAGRHRKLKKVFKNKKKLFSILCFVNLYVYFVVFFMGANIFLGNLYISISYSTKDLQNYFIWN